MAKLFVFLALVLFAAAFAPRQSGAIISGTRADSTASSPLIADTTGMETAWDFPRSPVNDSSIAGKETAEQIIRGFRLFTETPVVSQYASNKLTCSNCHLNGGQRERSMPLVGVAGVYPEFNKRAGRTFSLEDRIVECFKRSIDAMPQRSAGSDSISGIKNNPETNSGEVQALSAYISWLSQGYPAGTKLPWRGQNVIPREKLIPVGQLNPNEGEELYKERCSNCHGEDGQGVQIGDKKAGPLWGNDSWNDGAGAARIYTLAGMFMYAMPYVNPKSLTEEEAQQIAAYIDSKPRPRYPFKENDYPGSTIPADAVYYTHPVK